LIEAEYYPDDYDGVLIGAPVVSRTWGYAAVAWDYIAANLEPGHKLSDAKLTLLNKAAVAACNGKSDGLKSDPFIADPAACRPVRCSRNSGLKRGLKLRPCRCLGDDGERQDLDRAARHPFRLFGIGPEEIAALERLGSLIVGGGGEVIILVRPVVRLHAAIGDPPVQGPVGFDGGDEPLDLLAPRLRRSVLEAIFDEEVLHCSLLVTAAVASPAQSDPFNYGRAAKIKASKCK
jgi:hypothetical protein